MLMSDALQKRDMSAYQRWEMASFGETRPSRLKEMTPPPPVSIVVPAISEAEARQIRENAHQEGYAQGYQEAYQRGLREGQEAGLTEAQESMHPDIQSLHELAVNFSAEIQHAGKNTGKELLALAINLAENIIKIKIEDDESVILPIVEDAISQLTTVTLPAQIFLHPADAAIVRNAIGESLQSNGWRITEDTQLKRGDCRLETAQNIIDASVETRWSKLISAMRSRTL